MPRGDKSKYTSKQKRKARKIEQGYEKRGTSAKEAARRAWATVNKQDGGGKKGGSGTKSSSKTKSSSRKGTPNAKRSAAAKKGWATRRRNAARGKRKVA